MIVNFQIIFCVTFFSIVSCTNVKEHQTSNRQDNTINKPSFDDLSGETMSTINLERKMLNGIWTESLSENSLLSIRGDSIEYTDHLGEPVSFKINGDTMIIDLNGYFSKSIIVMLNDSALDLRDLDDNSVTHLIKISKR